jgi:hypothetical protein
LQQGGSRRAAETCADDGDTGFSHDFLLFVRPPSDMLRRSG